MEKNELIVGSHVSMNSPDFFLGSVQEAISYGSNAFMFYTGAPQNSYRKPLYELKINEGKELINKSHISFDNIIVHAPYIINPANGEKADLVQLTRSMIINELQRTSAFGSSVLVLHPGAHVGQGVDVGIDNLIECLNYVLSNDNTNVKIAIETMSGKGTEIGTTFNQINYILNHVQKKERIGVCLDTCHISDGGYSLNEFDNVLEQIENSFGIDKILVIHLNDSKNEKGSHKDRHENIGYGCIGFDVLNYIAHHNKLKNIPKILETPYIDGKPPYKKEIAMLRQSQFENNWKDNL